DFPLVLPHLRRNPCELEARVHALLRIPGDSPLVAEHAVFVHLEAATFGHRPQPNVVVFRTREVLQPGAPAVRVEDAQVDLDRPRRSLVVVILDAEYDLRLARGEEFGYTRCVLSDEGYDRL